MSYLHILNDVPPQPTPCIKVCDKPTNVWTHLDRLGTIATAIGAIGVIYSIWKGQK